MDSRASDKEGMEFRINITPESFNPIYADFVQVETKPDCCIEFYSSDA